MKLVMELETADVAYQFMTNILNSVFQLTFSSLGMNMNKPKPCQNFVSYERFQSMTESKQTGWAPYLPPVTSPLNCILFSGVSVMWM